MLYAYENSERNENENENIFVWKNLHGYFAYFQKDFLSDRSKST